MFGIEVLINAGSMALSSFFSPRPTRRIPCCIGNQRREVMKPLIVTALVILAFGTSQQNFAQAGQAKPVLKAGAAKVDITPAENELPRNYEGILDHLYARAIVLDSGAATAALIS